MREMESSADSKGCGGDDSPPQPPGDRGRRYLYRTASGLRSQTHADLNPDTVADLLCDRGQVVWPL